MTYRVKTSSTFLIAIIVFMAPAWLHAADPSDSGGQSAGWTPQQANEWEVSQMKYAQAVKQYGKDSPEATQAQVLMNTMARDLGIPPTTAVPEQASMDILTKPEPEIDNTAVGRVPSNDSFGSGDIDPDHPQAAPPEVQQAAESPKATEPDAEPAPPTQAPVASDPPASK